MLKNLFCLSLIFQLSFTQIANANEECNSALERRINWLEIVNQAQKKLKKAGNPFGAAGVDANRIGEIHQELKKALPVYSEVLERSFVPHLTKAEYSELQTEVIDQANKLLARNAEATELFALQESARLMSMIEARVKSELDAPTREQIADEQKKQQEKHNPKPEWNPPVDQYKPENKNLDLSDANKGVEMMRTSAEVPSRLLKEMVYDVVTVNSWLVNPAIRPSQIKKTKEVEVAHTVITTHGADQITIPFSYSAAPIAGKYEGFEVHEVRPGEYKLQLTDHTLKEVRIPLKSKAKESFSSSHNLSYYLSKQIPLNWWPDDIQAKVKALQQSSQSPLQKARELEKFFQTEGGYLYYSVGNLLSRLDLQKVDAIVAEKQQSFPKPVAMAFGKAFNCDGAAWIGALLNREYLQIPTRIVSGKTVAKKIQTKEGVVYAISDSGSPGHAWIEIWNENEWVPLDYTPLENQPIPPNSEPSESTSSESKPLEPSDQENESKKNDEKESKESKESKQSENTETKNLNKFEERVVDENTDLPTSNSKPKMPLNKIVPEVLQKTFFERLLMESARNRLKEEFSRYASSTNAGNEYNSVEQAVLDGMQVVKDAKDEEIAAWLGHARLKLSQGDLYGAWNEIQAIEKLIQMIGVHRSFTTAEKNFEAKVKQVLRQFQAIRHPDASAYELVKNIYEALPGPASKGFVKSKYGEDVLTLGSQSQKKFAQDLAENKLAPLVRMSLLSNYTDMVLNSEWIPSYETRASIYRSPVPTKKQDIVVARNVLEFQRMLLQPRPGEHLFEPLFQGRQFAIGSRETKKVPSRKTPLEKKFTVIFYDISGSMEEAGKIKYQDAMLMNFADHVVAEKDLFGNPLHELVLIPFGFDVYPKRAVYIRSIEDAKKFIKQKVNKETETPDGTDIEKALLYFYDLVARAHEENITKELKSFQRANLVLFSDGESQVDLEKVLAARKRVPKDIKIYMNFVGIGGTNEEIMELAKTSNLATTLPMLREISENEIRSVVQRSNSVQKNADAFASDLKTSEVPVPLLLAVSDLVNSRIDFRQPVDSEKLHQLFSSIKTGPVDLSTLNSRLVPNQLQIYIGKLLNENYPKAIKEEIALRVLEAYPGLSGRPLSLSLLIERDEFSKLSNWVKK